MGSAGGLPPGGLLPAGDPRAAEAEPGGEDPARFHLEFGVIPLVPAGAGVDQQHAVRLLQQPLVGVAEQHHLGLQLPGPAQQRPGALFDRIAVAVGEQDPHPFQLQQPFGAGGGAVVTVAGDGGEGDIPEVGGVLGVGEAVAAEEIPVRRGVVKDAQDIFHIAVTVAEYGEFHTSSLG